MTEFDFYKELFEKFGEDLNVNTKVAYALIFILSINIIVATINFLGQLFLKNKEKIIHRFNIRETKRMSILEQLYSRLEKLTYLDDKKQSEFIKELTDIEKFVSGNRLHIDSKYEKTTNQILDYYKSVLTDSRKKKFEIEIELLGKFVSRFNES